MVTFKERRNYLRRVTFFMGRFLSTHLRKLRCELSADYMGLESALKLMLEDGESLLFVTLIFNEIEFRV